METAQTSWPRARARPTWCIDDVQVDGLAVTVTGWIAPPDDRPIVLRANGRRLAIDSGIERPDVARLLRFHEEQVPTGFVGTARLRRFERPSHGLTFTLKHAGTAFPELDYAFPPPSDVPIPPPELRRRVHGGEHLPSFLLEGFSAFSKLDRTLRRIAGRGIDGFSPTLDWGCGCGRVSRHLAGMLEAQQLVGIDIDGENAAWCNAHLGYGRFAGVAQTPPTPLPSAHFELVFGVSVMTHLALVDQDLWLSELHRVTRPGALLCLTTHGAHTLLRSGLSDDHVTAFLHDGFTDGGENPDLTGSAVAAGYYRNTFNSIDQVREHWSELFEVVDIVEGFIGNHQDLVVLRKPEQ